ncbi:FAD-dependent thymidylate synthase [Candidatus Woesearchaeota archaeon]|nr:FAD-dependent thymidylate synthase [Candidatus Woesearchaeota archaeon]
MSIVNYSKDEKTVLEHFFSNIDKNVYFVKNLPEEVWATLKGSYSREHLSMRDNFLKKMKEGGADIKALAEAIRITKEGTSLQRIKSKITRKPVEQLSLEYLISKAGKFLETWAVKYGHNSLKEGAVAKIAVEDVSIILTKIIEDNRLASYIEKSTRYLDFTKSSLFYDSTLISSHHSRRVEDNGNMLMETYTEILEKLTPFVIKKRDALKPEKEKMKAWENACRAEAFDSARYVLPACVKTSLGWTVNARELEHAITKLLSSELEEAKKIGALLKDEGTKIFPTLIRHAKESEYLKETNKSMNNLSKNLLKDDPKEANFVSLVHSDEGLEDKLVAAILYKYSQQPYSQIFKQVKIFSEKQKNEVFEEYLKRRSNHEAMLRGMEAGEFVFDILIDFGAFRDIQRHRIGTQIPQTLTTFHGYTTPELIVEAGLEKKFRTAMEESAKNHQLVYKDYPEQAQYMVPLAFKKRVYLKFNPRQTAYFIELRSGEQGHVSYRKLAIMMHQIIEEKYPNFAKFIKVNKNNIDMPRLNAELKALNKK